MFSFGKIWYIIGEKAGGGLKMSDEKKPRCFVIMPISDQPGYLKGHFSKVYDQIFKVAIDDAGYEPYRVDEDNICDSIILKIFDGIQNCEMALCDLSSRNPNVLYELGLRQAYDKPVVLVQDEKTERIFDVGGINTIPYNSDRLYESVIDARQKITQALKDSKSGKGYSLIKIVKANKASFPEGDLSGNEKTEIMLQQIMFELYQLKQDRKNDDKMTEESILIEKYNNNSDYMLRRKIEDDLRDLEREVFLLNECPTIVPDSKLKELSDRIKINELNLRHLELSPSKKIPLYEKQEGVQRNLVEYIRKNKK